MRNLNISVRSLIIPLKHDKLLLPNASLAEIITYTSPDPIDGSPEWCAGILTWRGQGIPLLSFEALQGGVMAKSGDKSRVAVFNALGGKKELPFFAFVVEGIPHLVNANQSVVTALAEHTGVDVGVSAHVMVEAEPMIIPDLDQIESMIMAEKTISARL
ncbi:MAG TPA: chemotaxis protein CheW [Gammaproteobacteria bacterium]|nr:chemotaxis protein CheW [Gammaproteobacteria bacterium]